MACRCRGHISLFVHNQVRYLHTVLTNRHFSDIKEEHPNTEKLKEFRWENKQIYGPLLKTYRGNKAKVEQKTFSLGNFDDRKSTFIDSILTFPLANSLREACCDSPNSLILEENVNARSHTDCASVSSILSATMPAKSKAALERWEKMMIETLGEDGFAEHKAGILYQGQRMHSSISEVLHGTPYEEVQVDPINSGHWKSLRHILQQVNQAVLIENWVSHPFLNYRGIIDCIAKYRDGLVLIDWKSSSKRKDKIEYTYDSPLQIAAYMGAVNYDPYYSLQVNKGLLVLAYENGSPAQVFSLDKKQSLHYWRVWLRRLKMFETISTDSEKMSKLK